MLLFLRLLPFMIIQGLWIHLLGQIFYVIIYEWPMIAPGHNFAYRVGFLVIVTEAAHLSLSVGSCLFKHAAYGYDPSSIKQCLKGRNSLVAQTSEEATLVEL